jgi:serine/tyrosine/threonine adenylyltransferase
MRHVSSSLEQLRLDNTYARLGDAFGSRVAPTSLLDPRPVAWNPDAAALLGLNPAEGEGDYWVRVFSGHETLPGSEPFAMLYAGHQFGAWVPQLGDGRAILLGEALTPDGRFDLHLKGAGPTPYSRGFDGRAVLRSTIREYLCSEAMHGLGVPTTRALCIVGSDEPVRRERIETAATLVRVAPSHVRFGSFEVFAARRQHDHLRTLADYVIAQHFAELTGEPDRYDRFYRDVVERTARLIAQWQLVGWVHGVINTDNMSILGLTIDYGPFGFLDDYDPDYTPNTTDQGGRYAVAQQPGIALWNLTRLAEALLPLLDNDAAVAALQSYEDVFVRAYMDGLRRKLGLEEEHDDDIELADALLRALAANRVDYTRFWRMLGDVAAGTAFGTDALRDHFVDRDAWDAWAGRYVARLEREGGATPQRRERMNAVNPKYILRNYLAQQAIRKAEDERDFSELERLRTLLSRPFDEQPEMDAYADAPPDWGRGIALSCSS